ncbi:MAG: protein kinase [Myxococcales bacterium]|nr:protein kinase [Myxococcales bacterium]
MSELLSPGATINRLLVLGELGRGARGVVYQAYDPRLDRNVAVKLLRAFGDPDSHHVARRRLLREAQAMARLSHANVVTVHDVGTVDIDGDVHVFVEMEYVRGETLERRMSRWFAEPRWQKGGRWREIVAVYAAAGEGLAAAHAHGMIHRDFKPANVLITASGQVKVTDFGLVRRVATSDSSASTSRPDPSRVSALDISLTKTGALVGTPAYMAPEQYGGVGGDTRMDQFAFCVALWEALYGHRPFDGDTVPSLAHAVLTQSPRAPPASRSRVPARLRRVLERGLSKRPDDRYESMHHLLAALASDPWRSRGVLTFAAGALLVASLSLLRWWIEPGSLELQFEDSVSELRALEVRVDGALVPSTQERIELRAGAHRVDVVAHDHDPWSAEVSVSRGGTYTLPISLHHETGTLKLSVGPESARVQIDHEVVAHDIVLNTGRHDLRVSAVGAHEVSLGFLLEKDQVVDLHAHLTRSLIFERSSARAFARGRLGDADQDGYEDIWDLDGTTLTAYSPMTGRTLWSRSLSRAHEWAFLRMVDIDGDGVVDPISLGVEAGRARLEALDSRGLSEKTVGRDARRWVAQTSASELVEAPLAPPVIVELESQRLVVVTSLERRRVSAFDIERGQRRWDAPLPGESFALTAGSDARGDWIAVAHIGGVTVLDARSGDARWTREVESYDEEHLLALNVEDTLEHLGAEGRAWLQPAALDDEPGDELVLPVMERALAGELLAVRVRDQRVLWRQRVDNILDLRATPDLDQDGVTELQVARDKETQLLGGRDGRPLTSLGTDESVVRWPCDGPPRLLRQEAGVTQLRALDGEAVGEPLPTRGVVRAVCHDWDGDGRGDLIIATLDVLRAFAGGRPWRELGSIMLRNEALEISPLGDISADARPDFLLRGAGPAVVLGARTRWSRDYTTPQYAAPVVTDLNGDGEREVLVFSGSVDGSHYLELLGLLDGRLIASVPDAGHALRSPLVIPGARAGTQDLIFADVPNRRLIRVRGGDLGVEELEVELDQVETSQRVVLERVESYAGVEMSAAGDWLWVVRHEEKPQLLGFTFARSRELGETLVERVRYTARDGGRARPRLAQLDDAPGDELVAVVDNGRLVVLDGLRQTCSWSRWTAPDELAEGPALIDLDGDGRPELLVSGAREAAPRASSCEDAAARRPPEAAPDLLALNGEDGSLRWRLEDAGSTEVMVIEVSEERARWLLGVSAGLGLWAADPRGELLWSRAEYSDGTTQLRTGDLNGDGRLEVVYGTIAGDVRVHDARTGELRWTWRPPVRARQRAAPVPVDLDEDGDDELLVASGSGPIFALDGRFFLVSRD